MYLRCLSQHRIFKQFFSLNGKDDSFFNVLNNTFQASNIFPGHFDISGINQMGTNDHLVISKLTRVDLPVILISLHHLSNLILSLSKNIRSNQKNPTMTKIQTKIAEFAEENKSEVRLVRQRGSCK